MNIRVRSASSELWIFKQCSLSINERSLAELVCFEWPALSAIGEGGSGRDALANHLGGEAHRVLGCQLEQAVTGVALHVLVAVVLAFNVDHGGAVRAFALVQVSIIPFVIVGLGDLGQRCGLRDGVFCVMARLAGEAVRMAPRCFRELRAVSAAQAANVVHVADAVAVTLAAAAAGAFGTARHPIPSTIDALCIQPFLGGGEFYVRQVITVRLTVPAVIPDALQTAARALGPLAGNFRDQNLGVLAHGLSPVRRRPP